MIVFELDHSAAVDADEVIVRWFVEKVGIVGFLVLPEVDFSEEAGFYE